MERAESIWRPLGELLLEKKLLNEDELELALTEQAETGRLLGAILVERGYVSGPALAVALAEQYGVELDTERGFGTGLWAEIDRRHRAGREQEPRATWCGSSRSAARRRDRSRPRARLELERLEGENRRLQDEIERLRGEFTKLKLVEAPAAGGLAPAVRANAGALPARRARRPPPPEGSPVELEEGRFLVGEGRPGAVPGRVARLRVPAPARLTVLPARRSKSRRPTSVTTSPCSAASSRSLRRLRLASDDFISVHSM